MHLNGAATAGADARTRCTETNSSPPARVARTTAAAPSSKKEDAAEMAAAADASARDASSSSSVDVTRGAPPRVGRRASIRGRTSSWG